MTGLYSAIVSSKRGVIPNLFGRLLRIVRFIDFCKAEPNSTFRSLIKAAGTTLKTRPASATECAALAQALEASGRARVTVINNRDQVVAIHAVAAASGTVRIRIAKPGTTFTAHFFTFDGLNRFVIGSSSLDAVRAVLIARDFEKFTTEMVAFNTWQYPSSDVAEPRSDEDIDPRRVVYGLEVRGCALDLRELYKHGEPSCAHGS